MLRAEKCLPKGPETVAAITGGASCIRACVVRSVGCLDGGKRGRDDQIFWKTWQMPLKCIRRTREGSTTVVCPIVYILLLRSGRQLPFEAFRIAAKAGRDQGRARAGDMRLKRD